MTSPVLITGGAGFLGTWIGWALAESGTIPILFDVAPPPTSRRFDAVYVQGDILEPGALGRCIDEHGVGRIVHAAFVNEPLMGYADARLADHVRFNIDGTLAVCQAAISLGLGLIFISSKSVYGPLHPGPSGGLPRLSETHPKAPIALYGSTKLVCEQTLKVYENVSQLDYAIVRFATLWGPGKAKRYTKLAPHSHIVEAAARKQPCRLEHGGNQLDDMLYIKDAALNVAKLARLPRLGGDDFNFGTGTARRFGEIATILQQLVPSWTADVGDTDDYLGVGQETAAYCAVDTAKARQAFGFEARYDLDRALQDYLDEIK